MPIPNPPIKRKKIKTTNVWVCTDENDDLTTVGAHVYTWDGTGLCFGELFSVEITLEDDSIIIIDDNGDIS